MEAIVITLIVVILGVAYYVNNKNIPAPRGNEDNPGNEETKKTDSNVVNTSTDKSNEDKRRELIGISQKIEDLKNEEMAIINKRWSYGEELSHRDIQLSKCTTKYANIQNRLSKEKLAFIKEQSTLLNEMYWPGKRETEEEMKKRLERNQKEQTNTNELREEKLLKKKELLREAEEKLLKKKKLLREAEEKAEAEKAKAKEKATAEKATAEKTKEQQMISDQKKIPEIRQHILDEIINLENELTKILESFANDNRAFNQLVFKSFALKPCSKCNSKEFMILGINSAGSLNLECLSCEKKSWNKLLDSSDNVIDELTNNYTKIDTQYSDDDIRLSNYLSIIYNIIADLESFVNKNINSAPIKKELIAEINEMDYDSKLLNKIGTSEISPGYINIANQIIDDENPHNGRHTIPQAVQDNVWNRDGGVCVQCGRNENLEFDHIIPVSKGGANTYRNIQLLCEPCNRSKSDKIG